MNHALLLAGGAWRLSFQRRADRYGHCIEVSRNGEFRGVLESHEGTPDDAWPLSPPLQELHWEQRGDVHVALLVGRAGRSHWSLSVEAAAEAIVFDAACRVSEPPQWLGSTYRLLQPPANASLSDCGGVSVTPMEGIPAARFDADSGILTLPAILDGAAGKRTFRWQYRVSLVR